MVRITWMTGLLLSFSSVDIQCIGDHDFVLSVPQVLKHDLAPNGHPPHMTRSSLATTRKTFYSAPPPTVTHPSVFYQVPSLSSEPPPPLPSNFPSQTTDNNFNTNNNNQQAQRPDSSSSGTVLTKPSAITTSEEDRLLLVQSSSASAIASLPSIASSSSSLVLTANNNKVNASGLSPNTALLIAFLLSLIPTLAISLPFFAFRRRRRVPVNFFPTGRMFFES